MFDALFSSDVEAETDWPTSISGFGDLKPGMLVLALSTLSFTLSINVITWFIPEYLNRLGAGAGLIGLYASVALLVKTAYPYLYPKLRDFGSKRMLVAVASLAAKGTVLWVLAAQIGFVVPVPPWLTVTVGTMMVVTWQTHGPGALFDEVRVEALSGGSEGAMSGLGAMKKVGSLLLLIPATFVLIFVGSFATSVQVMATFIAALGFFATGSLIVLHDEVEFPDLEYTRPPVDTIRRSIDALTEDLRTAFYGDAIVHFAEAMVHVFLIVVIAEYHGIGFELGPVQFPPEAFFGLLVAIEMLVGLLAVLFGHRVVRRIGPKPAIVVGGLATALFPIALVLAPSHPAFIGLLFAFFGLRFAGVPARRALFHDRVEEDVAPNVEESTESIVQSAHLARDAAAVPGGVVGGILFGIDPVLAFGLAGVAALVGLRQFLVFIDG